VTPDLDSGTTAPPVLDRPRRGRRAPLQPLTGRAPAPPSPAPDGDSAPTGSSTPPIHLPLRRLRPWAFAALVLATVAYGTVLMGGILAAGGVTLLEIATLLLFSITFGWISVAFWSAALGGLLLLARIDPLTLRRTAAPHGPFTPSTRTALVMPVYHERPDRVLEGVRAILASVERTGAGENFEFHLLSDTTDPGIAREEEAGWGALVEEWKGSVALHYRRRSRNVGRKAGNLGEFCRRCVGEYDFMVVLDADSVMTGETLVELVRVMEANPDVGLAQTVPLPARQETLFGRLIQFASALYGPVLAQGLAFWTIDAANYWGHNAIVRLSPFLQHCTLPTLSGSPPLGGEVLSHDFVEAALLRRAGWRVLLLPQLGGSFEEVPTSIPAFARRDRRWAQGSLQHLRLLGLPGLHPLSRMHMLLGAMGYLSSVLWLLILIAGTAWVLLPQGAGGGGAGWVVNPVLPVGSATAELAARWAAAAPPVVPLLGVTALLLFLPKVLGLGVGILRHRRAFGGGTRLLASALLEALFGILVAPLLMMYHARFVVSILRGRSARWDAQVRDGERLTWGAAWRATGWITGVGVVWAGVTLARSPGFFLWMSPIFTGILLAPAIVRWTSSPAGGLRARRWGLFLVPWEETPPPELQGGGAR
jgi:membrane glycosyltransferase